MTSSRLRAILAIPAIALALLCQSAWAGNVTFSTTAPVPGPHDVANLVGSATDAGNVNGGVDSSTFVAFDQRTQGQTFTTGANAGGYQVNAFWYQQVNYPSFYYFPPGGTLTFRVTDPVQTGTAGFGLDAESYTTTGLEPNTISTTFVDNSSPAPGTWVRFGFDTPLTVLPNTLYGVDATGILTTGFNADPFFETNGNGDDTTYLLGSAYRGTSGQNGVVSNDLVDRTGDRVFLVELAAVPEPASISIVALGLLMAAGIRTRRAA